MKVYRISSPSYINDLSGTGSKLYGGRWNEKGTPLLYTAENISLAILEILVNFNGLTVPPELSLLTLVIKDDHIQDFPRSEFEEISKAQDAELGFKRAGEKWIDSRISLALKVPSIITDQEFNFLINPLHPAHGKLEKIKVEKLNLDKRLFV